MAHDCYTWNDAGLPEYIYEGACPAYARDRKGKDARLPEDPCFLLGNSRLTAFAHAGGRIELISGERGWARLNHLPGNDCWNEAILTVNGQANCLAGQAPGCRPWAEEYFGAGYARYEGTLPQGVRIVRRISVQPSPSPKSGIPALLLEVQLTNVGNQTANCHFREGYLASYCMLSAQEDLLSEDPPACYTAVPEQEKNRAQVRFGFAPRKVMCIAPTPKNRHPYDCFPPILFVQGIDGCTAFVERQQPGNVLGVESRVNLCPGETVQISFVVGWSFSGKEEIDRCCKVLPAAARSGNGGAFDTQWAVVLPSLADEADEECRWEMIWNAYVLLAMANYHAYFDATTVPQGSVYAYRLGQNTSMRDHLQHSLALSYLDPELARSSLLFVLQHECFDGRILRQDVGFGYEDADIYMESDPQLYLFLAVGEYLRITGDLAFLGERVRIYPVEEGRERTVLEAILAAFAWLRDVVRRGRHGLIMMRNSDWSDSFFHPYSPNLYSQVAESHLNSAMALVILPTLEEALRAYQPVAGTAAADVAQLVEEMAQYRASLLQAFLKDLGNRVYAPRCYIGFDDDAKLRFGEDRLCLEAQIWLMQLKELPEERRRQLADIVWQKIIAPEQVGARTRECPLWDQGAHGEDGGIWFAHQGPLMVGLSTVEPKRARELFRRLSFHHIATCYPDYWVGHWTAPDSLESTLSDREGLYHAWTDHVFQPYCAHIHAWLFYCYARLFAQNEGDYYEGN